MLLPDESGTSKLPLYLLKANTSETWSKAEINTFESGIKDFLAEDTSYPQSDYMENAKLVFGTVIERLGRLRAVNLMPNCILPLPQEKHTTLRLLQPKALCVERFKRVNIFQKQRLIF